MGDPARVSNRELRDELLLLQVRAMQPPRAGPLRLPLHEATRRHREPQRLENSLLDNPQIAIVSSSRLVIEVSLTQSELIEPVLPQAAQLGIHFYYFHNTQLEMHLLEGPD